MRIAFEIDFLKHLKVVNGHVNNVQITHLSDSKVSVSLEIVALNPEEEVEYSVSKFSEDNSA